MKKTEIEKQHIDVTTEQIEQVAEMFDNSDDGKKDKAVEAVFKMFPSNTDITQVLVKVEILNSFYSTRIKDKDIVKMAEHIVNLAKNERLDDYLKNGNSKAVTKIQETPADMNNAYSFATKYCSFSKEEKFTIVDSYSRAVLYAWCNKLSKEHKEYNNYEDFKLYEKLNQADCYDEYKKVIDFIKKNKVVGESITYKDIDKFLWSYGKYDINLDNIKNYKNEKLALRETPIKFD